MNYLLSLDKTVWFNELPVYSLEVPNINIYLSLHDCTQHSSRTQKSCKVHSHSVNKAQVIPDSRTTTGQLAR